MTTPERLFAERFEPLFSQMYLSAYRLTYHPADAEELVQETYLKAYRSLHRFDPSKGTPGGWLFTIMKNTFLNMARKKKEFLLYDNEVIATLPDNATENDSFSGDLMELLMTLPEGMRAMLIAREVHDMSYDEIATSFDLPLGTVKSRINRARTHLREKWEARQARGET